MLNRKTWSIILILLAGGVMLMERGVVGGLIGSILLVVMLFLWVVPSGAFSRDPQQQDPTVKRISQVVLGVGLGLFTAVGAALLLPPQLFSWVIIGVGIALIAWIFLRNR
ncbi:MAG: hypothetical protein JSV68_21325 [Anaerolineaceae bacterium]|nr:MAG: hypothetical protein JSV68_21325 [Anaerolineaceae bacterium]